MREQLHRAALKIKLKEETRTTEEHPQRIFQKQTMVALTVKFFITFKTLL